MDAEDRVEPASDPSHGHARWRGTVEPWDATSQVQDAMAIGGEANHWRIDRCSARGWIAVEWNRPGAPASDSNGRTSGVRTSFIHQLLAHVRDSRVPVVRHLAIDDARARSAIPTAVSTWGVSSPIAPPSSRCTLFRPAFLPLRPARTGLGPGGVRSTPCVEEGPRLHPRCTGALPRPRRRLQAFSATCEPTRTRVQPKGEKEPTVQSNPNVHPIEPGRNPSTMDEPEGGARRGCERLEKGFLCRRRSVRGGFEPQVVVRCGRGRHTARQTNTFCCDEARSNDAAETHIVHIHVVSPAIPRRTRAGGTKGDVRGVAKGSCARGWIPTQANRICLRTKPWKNNSCRC